MQIEHPMIEHPVRHRVSDLIAGAPFERAIRSVYSLVYSFYKQDPNFYYDKQTRAIMSRILSEDSNCIDVGANEGIFTKEMLKYAPSGKHMAFEPLPDLANDLSDKYPQVDVHGCALSDVNAPSTFQHVTNASGYSGLRKRHYDFGVPPVIRDEGKNKNA